MSKFSKHHQHWDEFRWEEEIRRDERRISGYFHELAACLDLPDEERRQGLRRLLGQLQGPEIEQPDGRREEFGRHHAARLPCRGVHSRLATPRLGEGPSGRRDGVVVHARGPGPRQGARALLAQLQKGAGDEEAVDVGAGRTGKMIFPNSAKLL